ncbi:MAG: hypothetical protein D6740_00880 [Alphaproteobacteria bacterium]|nr:MAG: hypothetical protein D6740_00880 [Alphaproteobacteria bacterium]
MQPWTRAFFVGWAEREPVNDRLALIDEGRHPMAYVKGVADLLFWGDGTPRRIESRTHWRWRFIAFDMISPSR